MAFDVIEENDEVVREPCRSNLYIWGCNLQGQTGHTTGPSGDPRTWRCQRIPQPLVFNQHSIVDAKGQDHLLVDASCGLQHTAAVTMTGELYTWGSNDYGQLGDGTEDDCRKAKKVEALSNEFVTAVACGEHCTAAISNARRKGDLDKSDGDDTKEVRLWLWGRGSVSNYPRRFLGAFASHVVVTQVSCGATHAAAMSSDGLLQTWGYNEFGQLGRGITCEGLQEARIVKGFVKFLDEPPVDMRVTAVACGQFHTAAIASDGAVYTWGRGDMGQLGHRVLQLPNREVLPRRVVALEGHEITKLACGQVHTCCITSEGALYLWGSGRDGQLGLGGRREMLPIFSGGEGDLSMQRLPMLLMEKGAKIVACGQSHTLVSTVDGRLLGWGYNSCGQAATGKSAYAWTPSPIDWCVGEIYALAAGGGHSAVLTQARSLKELCEFRLADTLTLQNAPIIEDVASRSAADSLMRFSISFRERALRGVDDDVDEDEDRRRRPRVKGARSSSTDITLTTIGM